MERGLRDAEWGGGALDALLYPRVAGECGPSVVLLGVLQQHSRDIWENKLFDADVLCDTHTASPVLPVLNARSSALGCCKCRSWQSVNTSVCVHAG